MHRLITGNTFLFKTSQEVGFFWLHQTELGKTRGHMELSDENSSYILCSSLSHMGICDPWECVRSSSGRAQGKHHLGILISNWPEHFKKNTLQNQGERAVGGGGWSCSDQISYPNAVLGSFFFFKVSTAQCDNAIWQDLTFLKKKKNQPGSGGARL